MEKIKIKKLGKYIANKFINISLAVFLIAIVYSGINLAFAALTTIPSLSNNSVLTQAHFTNVVDEVNNIAERLNIISNDNGTVNLAKGSSCTWQAVTTNGKASCPEYQYISAICLTNNSGGCANGAASGTDSNSNVAGGIKCCNTK